MKNTITLILFISFFCSVTVAQTQREREKIKSEYDLEKLEALEKRLEADFQKNYTKALYYAKQKGWKTKITYPDGRVSILDGISDDLRPIYITDENDGAAITSRANKLYPGGGSGLNLTGNGMTMGLWENSNTRASHQLFEGRVTIVQSTSLGNHATHVAGTIIGSGAYQNGRAKGMAYEANLRVFTASGDEPEVTSEAANGNLLSSHSYGISADGQSAYYAGYYDSNARDFDEIMYNAPYYLGVFSAGNDRDNGVSPDGYDLMTDMSCSKNGMTVGAVHQVNNYTGPGSVSMSSFSSWGPTDDGRIKPDIVAKGVSLYSAYSGSDSQYGTMGGTSMATPSTSGTLLLVQQHYKNVRGAFMKAATLKGLACHTADEAGDSDGPDYEFGWGLLNAQRAAQIITNAGSGTLINEVTLNQGQSYTLNVTASGLENLMSTICWTDPKGTVGPNTVNDRTPKLVNDLDIRITKSSSTYYPWKLNYNNPAAAATKADNTVDNIEKVDIVGASGSYTITVTHKGSLSSGSQAFSLIVTGLTGSSPDCAGVAGGSAYLDNCDVCVGGNTGYFPCVDVADNIYQISNKNSGKYLQNDGPYVTQQPWTDSVWKKWQVTEEQTGWYSIVNPGNGERFVATSISNSTPINSLASSDSNQYLFRFEQGADGAIRIVPKASMDKLLDMPGYSTSDGTKVTIYDRRDQANQQWIFTDCVGVAGGSAYLDNCDVCVGGNTGYFPCVDIADNIYQISNKNSGKYLQNDGPYVTQQPWTDSVWKKWQVTEEETGWYSIVNPGNDERFVATSISNNTPINSLASSDSNQYLFRFEQGDNGAIRIVPKASMDKLLDMPGYSTTDGTRVTIYDRRDQTNQQWIFTDCAGVAGGSAYLDDCDVCVGGNTGYSPCIDIADNRYRISNKNSGKYLQNDGPYVSQQPWTDSIWKSWDITEEETGWYSIVNPGNGERFVATSMTNSTQLSSISSTDSNQYLFRFEEVSNGVIRIVPKASMDKLVDMPGASTTDGTKVIIYDRYNNATNQQWVVTLLPDCSGVAGGSAYLDDCNVCVGGNTGYFPCVDVADDLYQISNLNSGKYLQNDGPYVSQQPWTDSVWKLWTIIEEETGWYSIVNPGNGERFVATSMTNSTQLSSVSSSDSNQYLFRFEQAPNGTVRIVPKASMDKLLDMPGWSTADGTRVTVYDRDDQANQQWVFTVYQPTLVLNCKALLQGACINPNSGEENMMRDDLRTSGYVPTTSPYSDNLTCTATVFNTTGSDAIVDWVWVELRDKGDNSQVITSRSGLLQRDGDIVGEDGVSALTFSNQSLDDYYIAIKHRNHLGIMSSSAIPLSISATTVDFTDASNSITYGTDAQTSYGMPSNTLGMWSGDANGDGRLNYTGSFTESTAIRGQVYDDPNNSVFGGPPSPGYSSLGYHTTDVDLNGATKYTGGSNDISPIRNNTYNNPSNSVFGGPPSPGYIFIQQLPEGANN